MGYKKTNFIPSKGRCIIKEIKEEQTEGGIYVPSTNQKEAHVKGILLDFAKLPEDMEHLDLKKGDTVMYSSPASNGKHLLWPKVKHNGEEVEVVSLDYIMGKIEEIKPDGDK